MIKVENIGSRIDMQTHTGKAATAAGSTAQGCGMLAVVTSNRAP